jgi:hypothetical protein
MPTPPEGVGFPDPLSGTLKWATLDDARLDGAKLTLADLAGANLSGARLAGAYLSNASLESANLSDARLEGTHLSQTNLRAVKLAGTLLGPSSAHSADLSGGSALTQEQLKLVIGDDTTILPRDAETGEWLHVWSCWEKEAAAIFIGAWTKYDAVSVEEIGEWMNWKGWICGPDNPRRPVGTPADDVVGGYR